MSLSNSTRLFIFLLTVAATIFGSLTTACAQEKDNNAVFKKDLSETSADPVVNTQNSILDTRLFLEISVINPNDRDAKNKTMTEVKYNSYSKNAIQNQRHAELDYWIKVTATEGEPLQRNHLFSIMPSSISRIDLYVPEIDSSAPYHSAYRFSVDSNPKFSRRAFVFELPDELKQSESVYFFVHSKKDADFSLRYWDSDDYYRIDKKHNSLLSMLYASLIILIIVNIIFYYGSRDKNYLLYILFLITSLIVMMTYSGKIYEFGIANTLATTDNMINAVKALCLFLLITFLQNFLKIKQYFPSLYKFFEWARGALAVLIGLSLALKPLVEQVPAATTWLIILALPILFVVTILTWLAGNRQARHVLYAAITLTVAFIIQVILGSDINSDNRFFQHAFQIGMVLQAILISIGMSDGVVDFRKQRNYARDESEQHSQMLEIEKKHAELLNRIKVHSRFNPNIDQKKEMLKGFFENLESSFNFHKAAVFYQIDDQLQIHPNKDVNDKQIKDYINENLIKVTRICHGNVITELSMREFDYFDKSSKVILIPVFLRGQEWSGMLLNIDASQTFTPNEKDTLHRHATEMVRSLLNVHMVNHIRAEVRIDPVTNTLNRAAMLDELEIAINDFSADSTLSIAMIDIDNFKIINETYGKTIGDACLNHLAHWLSEILPDDAVYGHMGGDDFLVILNDKTATALEKLMESFGASVYLFVVDQHEIEISVSIGITEYLGFPENLRDLMKRVDSALQASKESFEKKITITL